MDQSSFNFGGPPILDKAESQRRKEEGINLIASHNGDWESAALIDLLIFLFNNGPAYIEDWRADYLARGLPGPSHPNGWGALTSRAAFKKLVKKTGQFRNATSIKSNGTVIFEQCITEKGKQWIMSLGRCR